MIKYNNKLIVGGKYKGFYISNDGGASWSFSNNGINSNSFETFSFYKQDSLFACTNSGVYLFEENNVSWKLLYDVPTRAMYKKDDIIILGTNPLGLIYSNDNGNSWEYENSDLFLTTSSIISYKDHILAGSTNGLFKSINDGKTWEKVYNGVFLKLYNFNDKLYSSQHRDIFESIDDGVSWKKFFVSYYTANDFVIYGDFLLACSNRDGIFCKREIMPRWRGANWGLNLNNTRFLFVDEPFVFTSNDEGLWQRNLEEFKLPELEITDNYNFETIVGEYFRSPIYIGNHGYDTAFVSNIVSSNDKIKIKYESIIIPPDWSKFTSIDFFGENVGETKTTITINANTIQSVYKINVVISVIPAKFYLMQNYPNPFNPYTIIEYSIPKTDYVTLLIYNSAGQIVKTIVDEKQIGGKHRVRFSSEGLASGVYFYQLLVGKIKETRKMILVQ